MSGRKRYEGLAEQATRANLAHIGLDYDETAGSGLRIGVVDSVETPAPPFEGTVGFGDDYRPPNDRAETEPRPRHGDLVADVIHTVVPNATFEFFRVLPSSDADSRGSDSDSSVDDPTTIQSDPVQRAIDAAADRGVDVLNVSVGVDDSHPTTRAKLAGSVARATNDGVIVVAASGNSGKLQRVCQPANAPDAISVGGTTEACRYMPDSRVDGDERIWVKSLSEPDHAPFCGATGCTTSMDSCHNNVTSWWHGNVTPSGDNPHTAAPCHHVATYPTDTQSADTVGLVTGTSFAAPLITGLVARLVASYGDIDSQNLIDTLRQSGTSLGYDPKNDFYRVKADAQQLHEAIRSDEPTTD